MQPNIIVTFLALVSASTFFLCSSEEIHCAGVEVVARYRWGAQPAINTQYMDLPLYHVFISHTSGNPCSDFDSCSAQVRNMQHYHRNQLNWGDIGYSFLIGGDGRAYEGRGFDKVGAHTRKYNSESLGITFMGKFHSTAPNSKMLNAAKKLIECAVNKQYLSPSYQLHGHRDATCTQSPGDALYKIIQTWPNYRYGRMPKYTC